MADQPEALNTIEVRLARAGLIIRFERLWPLAILFAVAAALFLIASWLGLWLLAPAWARAAGSAVFAGVSALSLVLMARAWTVTRGDSLARLDRDSGRRHHLVAASQDRLANGDGDPFTRALWDLHRRRATAAAAAVRLAPPSPRLVDRDRFALRAGVAAALVAAAFVAGADKEGRIAAAFAWQAPAAGAAGFRVDAWIDPPPYTGRAPVLLLSAGAPDSRQPIAAPVNSVVVVRSSGTGLAEVTADGGLKDAAPLPAPSKAPMAPPDAERRFILGGDGHLILAHDHSVMAGFDLRAVPDLPPTIALTEAPRGTARGSLTLSYKTGDDYGVVGVEAAFGAPRLDGMPVTGRTLVEPPKLPLSLPNGARGLGPGRTIVDLSGHAWAGVEATVVVSARDEAGQTGQSAPATLRLPTRPFHKALARALVEQRRRLVFDPDHPAPVGEALDALALAPEVFGTTPAIYLGLTAARARLADARSDADLLGVADLLWSMALDIEEGDLSQTERDLRALQRELKDALARDAPPEEIGRLTEALRRQMEKFIAEMARRGEEAQGERAPPDTRGGTVTPKDLQALLDKMERAARDGDRAEAQQLLDQLRTILENLRSARQGAPDPGSQRMAKSMSQLDRMMRDQQALRDETFKRGNRDRSSPPGGPSRDGPQDPTGDPADQPGADEGAGRDQTAGGRGNGDLQGRQRTLRDSLQALQKQMRDLGLNGEQGFGDAEKAMRDAEAALGQGGAGDDRAVEAQGRALQGLQQGARGLQGQVARGQGQGEGQSPGEDGLGRAEGEGDQEGTDPLGRERGGRTMNAQGGLDAREGMAERARQVLEELRRRLGERLRPQDEQDYLERLLKRY